MGETPIHGIPINSMKQSLERSNGRTLLLDLSEDTVRSRDSKRYGGKAKLGET